MIDSGSKIIDVRTPQEFKSGHYPNSISIPLDTLKNNLDKIKGYENGIVVVCALAKQNLYYQIMELRASMEVRGKICNY